MRTKNGSVRELIAGIRQAAEQEEYNPAEDLKTLQTQYKRLGKKDFGLMLEIRCRGICSHPCCVGRESPQRRY